MKRHALLILFLLAFPLYAQSVKLPAEVKGDPGAWIVVVPESKEGGDVKWKVGPGLTQVPIDKLFPGQKPAGVVVQGKKGVYEVWAWNAKGDAASDLAVCKIIIGDAPDPGPKPPDPTPTPTDGKWLIMVWEGMDTLGAGQSNVTTSARIREWVRTNLKKTGGLPDGEFIFWDKDDVPEKYPQEWVDRWNKYKGRVTEKGKPWMIYSNGKTIWEGEIPDGVDKALEILNKQEAPKSKPVAPEGHH